MIDISKKSHELLEKLKSPFNGIKIYATPESEEETWDENHAIMQGVYWDDPLDFSNDSDYVSFDNDKFLKDFTDFVKDHFSEDGDEFVHIVLDSSYNISKTMQGIIAIYYEGSQELEIYRFPRPDMEMDKEEEIEYVKKGSPYRTSEGIVYQNGHSLFLQEGMWMYDVDYAVAPEGSELRLPLIDRNPDGSEIQKELDR